MTATALYSNSWHRVSAAAAPALAHPHPAPHLPGQVWYVMQDQSNGEFHRYTPEANLLISLMDGRRSVQQIWEIACAQLDDDAMPQDEVIRLMSQLHRADVLMTDRAPDVRDLVQRRRRAQKIKQYVGNPSALAAAAGPRPLAERRAAVLPLAVHLGGRAAVAGRGALRRCAGRHALEGADAQRLGPGVLGRQCAGHGAGVSAGQGRPRAGPRLRGQGARRRGPRDRADVPAAGAHPLCGRVGGGRLRRQALAHAGGGGGHPGGAVPGGAGHDRLDAVGAGPGPVRGLQRHHPVRRVHALHERQSPAAL